jgi:probable rRNA maturation factor
MGLSSSVQINDLQDKIKVKKTLLVKIIKAIQKYLNISGKTLSLVLVDNLQMSSINKEYFGKDRPTDVISFSLDDEVDPLNTLGEIIISTEKALENAKVFSLTVNEELVLYIIHGILHILGFKDSNIPDKKRMQKKEKEILTFLKQKHKIMIACFVS